MRIFSIIVMQFCWSIAIFAQHAPILFHHLTTKDGLSNNSVTAIIQDRNGFIWFGTGNKLNRYDGYSFKVFEHKDDDSTTLTNNQITSIAEDKTGKLWIGTGMGLNRFDPTTYKCARFLHDERKTGSLSNDNVNSVYVDKKGVVWVATWNGLNQFNPTTGKFIRYIDQLKIRTAQSNKIVTSIIEDRANNLWIGMWWGGFKKMDRKTGTFTDFFTDSAEPNGIENNNVVSLLDDIEGFLWIGNFDAPVKKFDPGISQFVPVNDALKKMKSIIMANDKLGNIWIRTELTGFIHKWNTKLGILTTLANNPTDPLSLSTGAIYSMFCDNTGVLWIGTSQDINFHDPHQEKFNSYYTTLPLAQRDYCMAFFQDRNKSVWIGIYQLGVLKYNPATGDNKLFFLNNKNINGIHDDPSGNIWVATNNGVTIIDPKKDKIINTLHNSKTPFLFNIVHARVLHKKNHFYWREFSDSMEIIDITHKKNIFLPIRGNNVLNTTILSCIIVDSRGNKWIGTEKNGVNRIDPATGKITYYTNVLSDTTSISNNCIWDIMEDYLGNIWISTKNGINLFDRKKNYFIRYSKKNGFVDEECFSIQEDSHHIFWISSTIGLLKFNPAINKTQIYNVKDCIAFSAHSLYQADDGFLYGGHPNRGFYRFHPDSIKDNQIVPPVYITNFLLFNEQVPVDDGKNNSPLKKSITATEELVLDYKQTVIGFEFAALNYTLPEKHRYAYQMGGFDKTWYYTDANNRKVTYTNLNPGNYVFRVKASNNDGLWNERGTMLKIKILPPPWKTYWAYTLYFLIIAFTLYYTRLTFIAKEKTKREISLQQLETEKQHELDEMKLHFFANISHEFRTPLTLITAPVNNIIQLAASFQDNQIIQQAGLIQRNAQRLAELTNQLLDMQKLDAGSFKPEIYQGDIVSFVKNIFERFVPLSANKKIDYQFICEHSICEGWFDPDKTEKIIVNLLSNAFKFTKNKIQLKLSVTNYQLSIIVEDNGQGISKEQQNKIFDRFYQIDTSSTRLQEGTGIGLSLVKELIELLSGKISVSSQPGQGICFTVLLPVEKKAFRSYTEKKEIEFKNDVIAPVPETLADANAPTAPVDAPLILIVEDNVDLRLYLKMSLYHRYRILEATNGKEGLEQAFGIIPELIISDVMMPEMDGVEMTTLLKKDIRTCHIPIILLTALTSMEDKIIGMETGADDYITKPFHHRFLMTKIRNLFETRSKWKEYYSRQLQIQPPRSETATETNLDDKFIQRCITIINNHLSDANYEMEKFATEMGMSESLFYQKTKALVGKTPGEIIRELRMKKAIELLKQTSMNISEIAFKVGFNDPKYFSKIFKKYYGISPSEYK